MWSNTCLSPFPSHLFPCWSLSPFPLLTPLVTLITLLFLPVVGLGLTLTSCCTFTFSRLPLKYCPRGYCLFFAFWTALCSWPFVWVAVGYWMLFSRIPQSLWWLLNHCWFQGSLILKTHPRACLEPHFDKMCSLLFLHSAVLENVLPGLEKICLLRPVLIFKYRKWKKNSPRIKKNVQSFFFWNVPGYH